MKRAAQPPIRLWYGIVALVPLVALVVTWLPEWQHWHVPRISLPQPVVERALDQMRTPERVELAGYDLLGLDFPSGEPLRALAADLERGRFAIDGGRIVQVHPGFAREDLENGTGGTALRVASLAIPDLWIRASGGGREPQYLRLARTYINEWLRFESASFLPTGLQWNDHAVSERVFVLSRYLLIARQLPEFSEEEAARICEYILQSGIRLTKPGYYTYRTNHGLMQNIALVHIGTVYPELPRARELAALGARRMAEQDPVYLSAEGVILEHSAGYHRLGVELLSIAARHLELAGLPVPETLRERLVRAIDVYASLRRPDGTLPSWGDTRSPEPPPLAPTLIHEASGFGLLRQLAPESLTRGEHSLLAPISGLALYRAGDEPVQTLVTWSDFATRAHKHRDEMSLLLWANGGDLLVGSGYWPHDFPLGDEAVGWRSTNAPHLVAEPTGSRTQTRLLGHASDTSMDFLDLRRKLDGQGELRRQVLYLRPDRWIVIDSDPRSGGAHTSVHWTFGPMVDVTADADVRSLELKLSGNGASFTWRTFGCEAGTLQLARESRDPFAGWTALSGTVQATSTLIRHCPPGTHATTIITRTRAAGAAEDLRPGNWASPERWSVVDGSGPVVTREGSSLVATNGTALQIQSAAAFEPATARVDDTYYGLARQYARFRESLLPYRFKMTTAIGALWLVQMVLMVPVLRVAARRAPLGVPALGVLALLAWLALAAWLHLSYFVG